MQGYHIYKKGVNQSLLEKDECFLLVEYMELKNLKFSHIHHEMFTRSYAQKNKAKALGVRSGVPDYIICLKDKLLFIEMKRLKGGKTSNDQAEWIESLNGIPNVEAVVCCGFDEAKAVIDENLANKE